MDGENRKLATMNYMEGEICVKPDKTCKVFIAQSDTEIIKCRFEESKGICNAVIRYKK